MKIEEYKKLTQKKSKYNAVKCEFNGIRFDSKKELKRYQDLIVFEKLGEVKLKAIHPKFRLEVNGYKICDYVADFEYLVGDKRVIEDVKGFKTPSYRLKKKLMKAIHGIEIQEI